MLELCVCRVRHLGRDNEWKVGESQDKLNPCGWTRPMQVLLASDLDGGGTLQQLTLC